MRVEELEAACHAASFESSLRRAMAQTSPACSVSATTDSNDSSQSYVHAKHDNCDPSAGNSNYQQHDFNNQFGQQPNDGQHSYDRGCRENGEGLDAESPDSADEYLRREGSDMESQASTSETEISGLKQQRREWEAEREALLREMNNLRSLASCRAVPFCAAYLPISACKLSCNVIQHGKACHMEYAA